MRKENFLVNFEKEVIGNHLKINGRTRVDIMSECNRYSGKIK